MLTQAQMQVLKTAILAETDPLVVQYRTDGSNVMLAQWYNQVATPAYIVWNTRANPQEIMANGIVWSDFKNLSAGQLAIWNLMTQKGYINAAKLNERLGLEEAFGKNSATNLGLQPHLKRQATRVEKLFATGTGTDASPGFLSFEGGITDYVVQTALQS